MSEQDWQATVLAELGVPSSGLMPTRPSARPAIAVGVPERAAPAAHTAGSQAPAAPGPAPAYDAAPREGRHRSPRPDTDPSPAPAWDPDAAPADAEAAEIAPVEPLISGLPQDLVVPEPRAESRPQAPYEADTAGRHSPAERPGDPGGRPPSGGETDDAPGTAPVADDRQAGGSWDRRPEPDTAPASWDSSSRPAAERTTLDSWAEPSDAPPAQAPWSPQPAPEHAHDTGPASSVQPAAGPAEAAWPQAGGEQAPDTWRRAPEDQTARPSWEPPSPPEPAPGSWSVPPQAPGDRSEPEPRPPEERGAWGAPHEDDRGRGGQWPSQEHAVNEQAQAPGDARQRTPGGQAPETWGPPGQEPWRAGPPAPDTGRTPPDEAGQNDLAYDDAAQVPWEAARSVWTPTGPPGDTAPPAQGERPAARPEGPPPPGAAPYPPQGVPPAPGQWAPSGPMAARDLVRRTAHGDPLVRRMSRSVRRAVGVSAADEVRKAADVEVVLNRPVPSCRQIAVTSIRGGAGKTTVAGLTATVISQYRQDRVLAVDADSGLGSLPLRMGVAPDRSVHDLAGARPQTFDEAERYLARTADGLWVLSGTAGGRIAGELELPALRSAVGTMSRYFGTAVIDCGAGLLPELQRGILSDSHAQVMVTPGTVDGALSAQGALEWQARNGYDHLLARTVIAFVTHTPHVDSDLGRAARMLSADGLPVVHIPYDRHLAVGTAVESARIGHETRAAIIRIAVEAFARAASV